MTTQPTLGAQQLAGSHDRTERGNAVQFDNSSDDEDTGVAVCVAIVCAFLVASVSGIGFAASVFYFLFV